MAGDCPSYCYTNAHARASPDAEAAIGLCARAGISF